MRALKIVILLFAISTKAFAQQPKIIGDCTVTFKISGADPGVNENLRGSSKTLYIKGHKTRVDISSSNINQTTIYDSNTGVAVILKEVGANKYMSTLDAAKWEQQNKKYDGMTISSTNETKTILGYECKKIVATLKNGNSFTIYYAPAIIPSAIENPYEFKNIPGFVLEYEMPGEKGNKINFSAIQISFSPVPASKFDIPKTGYRIL